MQDRVAIPVQYTLPLGGPVEQAFRFAPQFGLFNVDLGSSRDGALERRILDEAGSYGRQIGRIGEVLEILLRRTSLLERPDLAPTERQAIYAFLGQVAQVASLKDAQANPAAA